MPIINPQGSLLFESPITAKALFGLKRTCMVVKASWWIDTPVPFLASNIDTATGRPTAGSLFSLSKGPARFSYKQEQAEYQAQGDLYPREIKVVKETFTIGTNFITLVDAEGQAVLAAASGNRILSGVIGGVAGGAYNRRSITMIGRNLNPKAAGEKLVIASIYAFACDGFDFEMSKKELSKMSLTFKATKNAGISESYGVGRFFTI